MAIRTMFGMHPIILSALAIIPTQNEVFQYIPLLLLAQDAHCLSQKSEDRTGKLEAA